jgi:hypothetical protein
VQRNERGNPIERGFGFGRLKLAAQETNRSGEQYKRLKRIYDSQTLGTQASKGNRLISGADLVSSDMKSRYIRGQKVS